jgi:uncharacterized protein YlxW (UPF0749 family)
VSDVNDLQDGDRDRQMTILNRKQRGNGRENMSDFSTRERRILTGAQVAWRALVAIVTGTAFVLIIYFGIVTRQASAESKLTQHDAAIAKLEESKQSKEAADSDQKRILDKLESIEKTAQDLHEDVKEIRSRLDRRR